jgi:hypothetical protein
MVKSEFKIDIICIRLIIYSFVLFSGYAVMIRLLRWIVCMRR